MGYPTDRRFNRVWVDRGVDRCWNNDGTDVPANPNPPVEVLNVSNRAGELLALEVFTKYAACYCLLTIDGNRIDDYGALENAANLRTSYDSVGIGNVMRLTRYDTVNSKYIFELVRPIPFGNSLKVELFSDTQCKASVHIWYMYNT